MPGSTDVIMYEALTKILDRLDKIEGMQKELLKPRPEYLSMQKFCEMAGVGRDAVLKLVEAGVVERVEAGERVRVYRFKK